MLDNLKKYYRNPLYRNSIAMTLNSAFAALFGLLFWMVAARTILSKGGLGLIAMSGWISTTGRWLGENV